VAAAPWELEAELNRLGVVELKPAILRQPRPGKLAPDPKPAGKFYRNGEEPEF